jgi:hypothetical protein
LGCRGTEAAAGDPGQGGALSGSSIGRREAFI